MFCQRYTPLPRSIGPAIVPFQILNRAESTSRRFRPQQAFRSATACSRPSRLASRQSCLATPLASARLHTSTVSPRAAASSPESEPLAPPAIALEKPDYLNAAETVIWDRLVKEFNPLTLVVQDISGGCGSMYGIEISSDKFRGATMLKQQRMVNAVLGDMMREWHGCQLKTRVP